MPKKLTPTPDSPRSNKPAIRSDLAKVDRHKVTAAELEDAPELTDAQLAKAVVEVDGKPMRRGRPPKRRASHKISG